MTTEQKLLFSAINLMIVGLGTIISNQSVLLTEAEVNVQKQAYLSGKDEIIEARLKVLNRCQNNIRTLNEEIQRTSKEIGATIKMLSAWEGP